MLRHFFASFIALSLLSFQAETAHAQSTPIQQAQLPSALASTISGAIGAEPNTVEITLADNILTVLRVNSNMNKSTHGGRDNEANVIGTIVSKAIVGIPDFKNLHTIRIQYVVRSDSGRSTKVIDSVDFRKSPAGSFEFHKT